MNDPFFFLMILFGIVMLVSGIRYRKHPKNLFKWTGFWLIFTIVFLFPTVISNAVKFLGLSLPFNVMVMIGFAIIFLVIWNIYGRMEEINKNMKKLVQKIAVTLEEKE